LPPQPADQDISLEFFSVSVFKGRW